MRPNPRECETSLKIDPFVLSLMQESMFFAEISRHVRKYPSRDIPTFAMSFDQSRDEFTLVWNPDCLKELTRAQVPGILKHEFYHLIFSHVTERFHKPQQLWNIATDLAINSLIMDSHSKHRDESRPEPLPKWVLMPGQLPYDKEGNPVPASEIKKGSLAYVISKLPPMKASEWYFSELLNNVDTKCPMCGRELLQDGTPINNESGGDKQSGDQTGDQQKNSGGSQDGGASGEQGQGSGGHSCGDGGCDGECGHGHGSGGAPCPGCSPMSFGFGPGTPDGTLDDHSFWENVPEEMREYVEGRMKAIVEKAVKVADQDANGWGDVPAEMRSAIRASVSRIVDWKSVLRQFVGTITRGARRTSIKRINKRYPYIHPGTTRGYVAKLIIAIDQSGSVDDEMLATFFAELASLTKQVSVDILPFDCSASAKDIFEWRRGTRPDLKREKMGGTDFNAPTRVVNAAENRGRWDGFLIMTDGECGAPENSRVKRGYVIGKGQKLFFDTTDLVIKLDDEAAKKGAWY